MLSPEQWMKLNKVGIGMWGGEDLRHVEGVLRQVAGGLIRILEWVNQ